MPEARRIYSANGTQANLKLAESANAALIGADVLVIVTEWSAFRSPDFAHIHATLKYPVLFDGRNMFDPEVVANAGLSYMAIGRPVRPVTQMHSPKQP
jgi:UDPglucose 6-dehydrogenase